MMFEVFLEEKVLNWFSYSLFTVARSLPFLVWLVQPIITTTLLLEVVFSLFNFLNPSIMYNGCVESLCGRIEKDLTL